MDKQFDKVRFASRFTLTKAGSWQETAIWRTITFSLVLVIWELIASHYNSTLLMPHPLDVQIGRAHV